MMSIQSFLAGLFIIVGCATGVIVATAIFWSMQFDNGTGLLVAIGALLSAALALGIGLLILIYTR